MRNYVYRLVTTSLRLSINKLSLPGRRVPISSSNTPSWHWHAGVAAPRPRVPPRHIFPARKYIVGREGLPAIVRMYMGDQCYFLSSYRTHAHTYPLCIPSLPTARMRIYILCVHPLFLPHACAYISSVYTLSSYRTHAHTYPLCIPSLPTARMRIYILCVHPLFLPHACAYISSVYTLSSYRTHAHIYPVYTLSSYRTHAHIYPLCTPSLPTARMRIYILCVYPLFLPHACAYISSVYTLSSYRHAHIYPLCISSLPTARMRVCTGSAPYNMHTHTHAHGQLR